MREYEEFAEFSTPAEWMAAQERLALAKYAEYEEWAQAQEEFVHLRRREIA